MSDPISLDDAYGPSPAASPLPDATPAPISADDAYAGAVPTEKSTPQFEGYWRKPLIFGTNMIKGALNSWGSMMDASGTVNATQGMAALNVMNELTGDPKRYDLLKDAQIHNLPKMDAAAQKAGLIDRPELAPQYFGERLIGAGGQGVGGALSTGAINPRGLLNAFGGGVGSETAHELFPNSEVAPLIGGLAGGVGIEAPRLAVAGTKALARPFTQAGQSDVVSDLIRKAAVNPESLDNLPASPIPGMQLTLGQLSNDPGIQALERSVEGSNPETQGAVNARAATNNAVIRNTIGSLHSDGIVGNPVDAMTDASTRMRGALEENLTKDRAQEKSLWTGLDAQAPTGALKADVASYASGQPVSVDGAELRLSKARQRFLPDDVVGMVSDLSGTEPLNELTDLRSVISTAQREASNAGEFNKANVLGGLDKILLNRINNLDVPPEQLEQYTAARDFSKQLNDKYSRGPVAKVLGTDPTGADKVPPTATGGQFFKSGPGGLEALQSYAKAIGDNQEGVRAAKDYAVANMLKQGSSSRALDINGQPKIDFGNLNNHLNNTQHVLESGLFSPEELAQIEAAHLGSDMASRTARSQLPYGSSTVEKIKSGQYVEFPIHPAIPKAIGMVTGAIGGGHVGGLPGAALGALEGGNLASKVYKGPNAKIGNALQQRLLQPDAAAPQQ